MTNETVWSEGFAGGALAKAMGTTDLAAANALAKTGDTSETTLEAFCKAAADEDTTVAAASLEAPKVLGATPAGAPAGDAKQVKK